MVINMLYDDFLAALATPDISVYVKEGISRSYPVIGINNGNLVDCFFLYSVSLDNYDLAEGPVSVLTIDSISKTLVEYKKTDPKDLDNSLNCENDEFWLADKEFREIYPKVRSFSFANNINQEQKEILQSFMRTFRLLVNDSFFELYKELCPDFFIWTEQILYKG